MVGWLILFFDRSYVLCLSCPVCLFILVILIISLCNMHLCLYVISHDSYHHQGRRVSDRPVVFWLKFLDPARLG